MKNFKRKNVAIVTTAVVAAVAYLCIAVAAANAEIEIQGNYPTALVATGSNLDSECVRDAAYCFDYILTTPYGYQAIKDIPELQTKTGLFISYFSTSRYDGTHYGIYPTPKEAGMPEMHIIWDRQMGFWSYGYELTDEWVELFVESVCDFIERDKPLFIMLDDHKTSHMWWDIDEDDYEKMHPADLKYKINYIDAVISAKLKEVRPEAFLMVNGVRYTENVPMVRYWEGCGRSYNQWGEVLGELREGDWLQVNDGPTSGNWGLAGFVGFHYGVYQNKPVPVALGYPDGEPLWTHEAGEKVFRLPLPEDGYYRWERKP